MTIFAAWSLVAFLHLAPQLGDSVVPVELADAIGHVVQTREDAALLVSLAWWETGKSLEMGLVGDHGHSVSPWQLWSNIGSARQRELAEDLEEAAREALVRAHESLRACHAFGENALSLYTTGRCQTNREARLRWRTRTLLLARVPLDMASSPTMGELNRVVVWDPMSNFWEGSLVDQQAEAVLASRGVCLLPIWPELIGLAGCGGFGKRSWGAGWPLDATTPRAMCPLTVYGTPATRQLYWAVRLVPEEGLLAEAQRLEQEDIPLSEGFLSITSGSTRGGGQRAGITPARPPVSLRELGRLDSSGGWTVTGRAVFSSATEGYFEFCLYGAMPGIRAAWVAATLVR